MQIDVIDKTLYADYMTGTVKQRVWIQFHRWKFKTETLYKEVKTCYSDDLTISTKKTLNSVPAIT